MAAWRRLGCGGSAAVGSGARRRLQLPRATHHYNAQRQRRRRRQRRRSDGGAMTASSEKMRPHAPRSTCLPGTPLQKVESIVAASRQTGVRQAGVRHSRPSSATIHNLAVLCTPRRTVTSRSAAHAAKTGRLDQTTSERQSGARRLDVLLRRGFRGRRRAPCFAGGGTCAHRAGGRSTWPTERTTTLKYVNRGSPWRSRS